jgi:leader peptidase (prepilin peptidase)/N-methyltransferase
MLDKIILFIFALVMGSFLNVIIYRIPARQSLIKPRSHCPNCNHQLKPYELVPLFSFIFLKGRCRCCHGSISIRYPLVEFLTGVSFLLVYLKFGWSIWTISGLVFTGLLIAASFIDLDHGIIPDQLTGIGFIAALIFSCFTVGPWLALSGAALLAGILLAVAVISQGGMGGGDIKLGLVIGGFCSLPNAWLAFSLAVVTAGLWGLLLVVFSHAHGKTPIKFGPFLAWGGYLAYNYHDLITKWYSGCLFQL